MSTLRFIMIGGFLGAGKTTALARLARHYLARGRKVGIVTNDQADGLVDTESLRAQGLPVEEVAGACFCCRFDDLMDRVERLNQAQDPSVILAEPVGSCTDLVATVVQPVKDLYGERFSVAPYLVLFKPSHGRKILRNEPGAGFSTKAAYIFRKQLEEADAIAINRLDELKPGEAEELTRLVQEQFPGVPVLSVSAKSGAGFEAVNALLEQEGNFGRRILDIDYDTYAEGEAELGWLNSTVRLKAANPFALDRLLLDLITDLQAELRRTGAEVAHLKTIGLWEGFFGVANLVGSGVPPEMSLPSNCRVHEAEVIVNARVAIDPAVLEKIVRDVVTRQGQRLGATVTVGKTQSFRPGRPTPTHRYAEAR
jgi:G3E family GTPase